jgi:hypothetical protein
MTKSDICRAIAERMEPKPDKEPWTLPMQSRKKFWVTASPAILDGRQREFAYWVPFDPFTSESANALLLQAIPDVTLWKHPRWVSEEWGCSYPGGEGEVSHVDRKTAVVLAKCKELGIEVGEIDG